MKNLIKEINKIDRMSVLLIKYFFLISAAVILLGYVFTFFIKNTELSRYFLIISASLMAEGIWGGVLLDCIKRRTE